MIPDRMVEKAASQLAEEQRSNAEAGHPWALGMGDRYAAQRCLEAAGVGELVEALRFYAAFDGSMALVPPLLKDRGGTARVALKNAGVDL